MTQIWRAARFALVLAAAVAAPFVALAPEPASAQAGKPDARLKGGFYGVGDAKGMRFVIRDAGKEPSGTFFDSNGKEAEIKGHWVGDGVEAVLAFDTRPIFIRLTARNMGAEMLVIPVGPDGNALSDQARRLGFLRDGVKAPEQPAGYQNPPERADGVLDPDVFLISYEFWPPDGVARGFSAIGPRYRTMIRLYPLVHADVLWKLCAAPGRPVGLAEALRGQGVTCQSIREVIEGTQKKGTFDRYKAAVDKQRDDLVAAVKCARGYIVRESVCGPASRRAAEAAVSMETVATALAPYR